MIWRKLKLHKQTSNYMLKIEQIIEKLEDSLEDNDDHQKWNPRYACKEKIMFSKHKNPKVNHMLYTTMVWRGAKIHEMSSI